MSSTAVLESSSATSSSSRDDNCHTDTINSGLLQNIVKGHWSSLYSWYSGKMAVFQQADRDLGEAPDSSPSSQSQRRLHERAEQYGSSLKAGTASVVMRPAGKKAATMSLADLPVGVLLHVALFLDAKSLCRLQQTCKHLLLVMSDELLWRKKLWMDAGAWPVLGHLSHPKVYEDVGSDLSYEQIYASCYTKREGPAVSSSFTTPITNRLRTLLKRIQGHVPRILMFGSGLESVPLVRTMMWEKNSPYKPAGMFPGKDGVGSGVCIRHKNTSVNLVTLYTATKAERTAASSGQMKRVNKLVAAYGDDVQDAPELTAAVQDQCQQADGFILAVDGSRMDADALEHDMTLLKAMLHSSPERTSLLVLVCQVNSQAEVMHPLEVADKLCLCNISHPWQIYTVVLGSFSELQDGLDWLLRSSS